MFGWFSSKSRLPLAPIAEREVILAKLHPVFRDVDAAFHAYLEVVVANASWSDQRIEQTLVQRGINAVLAEGVVLLGPIAWGREVVEQLGVQCSANCRLSSLSDGEVREVQLATQLEYAWARAMIGLYRTPERNEVFKLVACRSAELDAVNNALQAGTSPENLRGGTMQPLLVNVRRRLATARVDS
ncbi:MAG: hypothetical protein L0211_05970 [Planctomycetaceae bacterium]|nr:hypothetical protein [Planctomycetaceae bacterium]